ncbi:hypothetical protein K523DRAFT_420315 [Schizophyllum commune Tattone D]|nr:hypothetical protein K523DRAFT_420315 [Schizophyllum commune Tattone D]
MSDSTTFNVNLFDGAIGGPCIGDGSDSESQQSQATCVGQEDDPVVQSHALGPENTENPMQYSSASTVNAPSTNDASSASQSLSFPSNDLRPHIDAVDPALPCSAFAFAFDSAPALESTSASDPAPASNSGPAFNDSPILNTNALTATEAAPSASPQQEHIPSQESEIPTFHDDLQFETAIAQPDSSQDLLTTASSTAEPSVYEEQSPSREDVEDHVDDRQAYPGNESADDVECQEDFEAHTVDGGAYNEVHGGDYCAHYDSPAASNDYGDSRHVTEPSEYQSHLSDQEPVEHWEVSHDDDGHSEDVHMSEDAESASSPAYNADVQMAHADEVCGDVVRDRSSLQPEVGWQLDDEGSDDDLYVRDDEPCQRPGKSPKNGDVRDELDNHGTLLDGPNAEFDEPTDDQRPPVEGPICPPSSSPPSSSPPIFSSSSQVSRPSSQSSTFVDPVEKMDEDVVEVTVNKDITGEVNAEVAVDEDAKEEVVSEDVEEVNVGETVGESVGKKTGEDVALEEKEKVATTVKDDIAIDDCEDIAEGMNVSTPAMMTEAAPASSQLQTPLDSHWLHTKTALQPDSDFDQGEPTSWHHEKPEAAASLGTEDSTTKAPTLTRVDIASNDTTTPSEPKPMVPQKRKFEFDEDDIEITRHVPPPPPTTKRPTALAYKAQSRKLAKPFRPPAMKPKVEVDDAVPPSSSPPRTSPPRSSSPAHSSSNSTAPKPPPVDRKKQHRTQRAASQFKSPLTPGASAAVTSNVRLTPQIQALERKLQVLKRAVKVRREGEEGTLEGLVKRWTEAGREVAWEVWGLTKEAAQGGDWGYGSGGGQAKGGFGSSGGFGGGFGKEEDANKGWGWDKEDEKKGGSSWGWANEGGGESQEEEEKDDSAQYKDEEEEVKPQQTLGTMLRLLGIAPETLGWDDNEEGFVDA